MNHQGLRAVVAVLGACGAAALGASPAAASTAALSPDGRFLDITESSPGERNDISISIDRHPDDGSQYITMHDSADTTPGRGCWTSGARVHCLDPAEQIRVATGGGADRVQPRDAYFAFADGALRVDLGDGDDEYDALEEEAMAIVDGGPGADRIRGGIRADALDGGAGNDDVEGDTGTDAVRGGEGDDTVTGDPYSERGVAADVVDGGAGTDVLEDYNHSGEARSAPPIDVSLDGVANDGRSGEGDNVTGVERIKSGSAGSFTGDEGPNEFVAPQTGAAGTLRGNGGDDVLISGDAHGDVVEGGTGNDTIEGAFGDDRLVGGPGRDVIAGDRKTRCNEMACDIFTSGNDTIEARDGEVDSVSCGTGTDRVVADADDVVDADCETVERSRAADPGGDGPRGDGGGTKKAALAVKRVALARALKRGLRVTVRNVSGRVRLVARRKRLVLARGSARAKGGRATVTLRFTPKARRSLRRARKVSLRVSGAGAAKTVTLKR